MLQKAKSQPREVGIEKFVECVECNIVDLEGQREREVISLSMNAKNHLVKIIKAEAITSSLS